MKRKVVIIVCLLFNLSFGQEERNKLLEYQETIYKEFNQKGITQYMFFSFNCPMLQQIEIVDEDKLIDKKEMFSINQFEAYLIWKENAKVFLKRISNKKNLREMEESNKFEVLNFDPFRFIGNNLDRLKNDEVLGYEVIENGEKYLILTPTGCRTKFQIFFNSQKIENDFDTYNHVLSKNFDDDNSKSNKKIENINYKSNNNLKLIKLYKKLNEAISKINFNTH